MKVTLTVVEGKPEGLEIPLKGPRFTIGRDARCNLRPNSDLVCKQHCLIQVLEEGVTVRDLGSTNGTFVNDVQINDVTFIKNGDRVRVGPLTFSVRGIVEAVAKVAPPSVTTNKPAAKGKVDDDDPLQWLLADDQGQMHEPSGDTTVMDLKAAATETVAEKKEDLPTPPAEQKAPSIAGKVYRPPAQESSNSQRNTQDAASDILNRYLVRRRPG